MKLRPTIGEARQIGARELTEANDRKNARFGRSRALRLRRERIRGREKARSAYESARYDSRSEESLWKEKK